MTTTIDANKETAILLVDDQELVRSGLRTILRRKDGFVIVGECAHGGEVLEEVNRCNPDIVVMDLRMKFVGGIEAIRRLQSLPDPPRILVLTAVDDDDLVSGALRAGASGFIFKDSSAETLVRAVKAVAQEGAYLDPAVTARVLSEYRRTATAIPPDPQVSGALTSREYDVLTQIGRGRSNAEIAGHLDISTVTVKSHIRRIFGKLDLRDRAAAIVFSFDHGLSTPREQKRPR